MKSVSLARYPHRECDAWKIRSRLTGLLSRRNTASHRCYTRHRALPLCPPRFHRGCRITILCKRVKNRRHLIGCLRKKQIMTSYGGIIRIRLKGRSEILPLSLLCKLPCFIVNSLYCLHLKFARDK